MQKSKLSISKKADASVGAQLLFFLKVVLEIGIFLLLIYIGWQLYSSFSGKQDYDSTINNLENLYNKVAELVKDKKALTSLDTSYAITDDYILVGFSYEEKGRMNENCGGNDIIKSRPAICGTFSCLCIYTNNAPLIGDSDDFDSNDAGSTKPLKCRTFDQRIVFVTDNPQENDPNFRGSPTDWKPPHNPSPSYDYLVIYGQCGKRAEWGIKEVYIEKYQEAGINYIYFGDITKEHSRKQAMKELAKGINEQGVKVCNINPTTCRAENIPCNCPSKYSDLQNPICYDSEPFCYQGDNLGCNANGPYTATNYANCKSSLGSKYAEAPQCQVTENCQVASGPCFCSSGIGGAVGSLCEKGWYCYIGNGGCKQKEDSDGFKDNCKPKSG